MNKYDKTNIREFGESTLAELKEIIDHETFKGTESEEFLSKLIAIDYLIDPNTSRIDFIETYRELWW